MEQRNYSFFRKQATEKVSSPEHPSRYLRVTNPGVSLVLTVIILLLAGCRSEPRLLK